MAGYELLATISVPGGLTANDISWVDSANARYYLADRGNTSATPPVEPRIDVIDTQNFQWITSITLPAAGNGVVCIPRAHELWVGLNDSTAAVISTDTNTIKTVISTGGTGRADELAFDPLDRLILIANDRDSPPFVTFISTDTHSVVKRLTYDGVSAPQATSGIEQPLWDAEAGKFYISIPSTNTNANGEMNELDPLSLSVTRRFPRIALTFIVVLLVSSSACFVDTRKFYVSSPSQHPILLAPDLVTLNALLVPNAAPPSTAISVPTERRAVCWTKIFSRAANSLIRSPLTAMTSRGTAWWRLFCSRSQKALSKAREVGSKNPSSGPTFRISSSTASALRQRRIW